MNPLHERLLKIGRETGENGCPSLIWISYTLSIYPYFIQIVTDSWILSTCYSHFGRIRKASVPGRKKIPADFGGDFTTLSPYDGAGDTIT